jgi:hypothetical protein
MFKNRRKKILKYKWWKYPRWPPNVVCLGPRHFSTKTAEILGYDSLIGDMVDMVLGFNNILDGGKIQDGGFEFSPVYTSGFLVAKDRF